MEELQAKHRKEQRDLQSKITQKKKNASKKTRKGVNDECDALQRDLQERQQAELATLVQNVTVDGVQALHLDDNDGNNNEIRQLRPPDTTEQTAGVAGTEKVDSTEVNRDVPATSSAPTVDGRGKKPNRQKARLARRAAEQEAQVAQAAQEAVNFPDLRERESEAMKAHLTRLGLTEITIRPDGHCMYSAVATQLQDAQLQDEQLQLTKSDFDSSAKPYQLVRNTAGEFISNHPDDFAAFLEEPLDVYVSKIKDTAEWGGQLELQALARAYDVEINVVQANGRVEKIGSGSDPSKHTLWLAYYRHCYALGEHYNALKKLS